MSLNDRDRETILTLADNDMNVTVTAKKMYMNRNTVVYRLDKIKGKTGLDPRCFYDLLKLLEMASANASKTNADKIRSMSDAELAEFLDQVNDCPCFACCNNVDRCRRNNAPEPVCKRHYLDWLGEKAALNDSGKQKEG